MKSEDLQAFAISRRIRRYGAFTALIPLARDACWPAASSNMGVRFIEVEDSQNWDTHNDHVGNP